MATQHPRYSASLAGVITDDRGCALLIRRAGNHRLGTARGVLELAESIHDGVRWEVPEETGLDVETDRAHRRLQEHEPGNRRLGLSLQDHWGDLTTTDEASTFRSITDAEVAELAEEAYAIRVLDGLNGDRPPAVRLHDGVHLL